ncbi:hypothetical protein B6N60_04606 [Richelia sinica FACHB-800]|uniref:Uncharacterized protein n=1 Tax=Richelia sinica FACHB-800 TaxID=1357546 RepID=A0A975TDE7_9NOST|nr:hypothetical protein B6N60_04606 [Richelia sinica FACHB-800]
MTKLWLQKHQTIDITSLWDFLLVGKPESDRRGVFAGNC